MVELNAQVLARLGVKVFTVYDALNDNRNLVSSVRAGRAAGMKINCWMTYTLSPDVESVAGAFTPVPGGVGPLTIAMVLSNTITAAERRALGGQ